MFNSIDFIGHICLSRQTKTKKTWGIKRHHPRWSSRNYWWRWNKRRWPRWNHETRIERRMGQTHVWFCPRRHAIPRNLTWRRCILKWRCTGWKHLYERCILHNKSTWRCKRKQTNRFLHPRSIKQSYPLQQTTWRRHVQIQHHNERNV